MFYWTVQKCATIAPARVICTSLCLLLGIKMDCPVKPKKEGQSEGERKSDPQPLWTWDVSGDGRGRN